MRLSVIVASHDAPQALERCLAALAEQDCEIVVSDGSESDPRPLLASRFPTVRWLRSSATATRLPELYWRALDCTSADIVGLLEARAIPARSWADAMSRAHAADGEAVAVGGPVAAARGAGRSACAYYIAEFARFAPPLTNGRCDALCDANVSYKRAFLEQHRERLQAGVWPSALQQQAAALRMAADAAVEYVSPSSLRLAAAERLRHGKGYAATRVCDRSAAARLPYAAFTPALPLLLLRRQWRDARRAGISGAFWTSLPQTLALDAAWSAGEFLGYAAGPSSESEPG